MSDPSTSTPKKLERSDLTQTDVEGVDAVIDKAKALFEAGKLGESFLILDAASKATEASDQIKRQRLVIQLAVHGRNKEYWKVLGLSKGAADKDVKTNYKKLAAQVHPDKCNCFGAEDAFQCLTEAISQIQGSAEGGFVKEAKKDGEHHWWDKWESSPATSKRKRKREEQALPQDEEEILHLRQCPIEELRREVATRQASVLRPDKDSLEAKMTAAQRQQRVRMARNILNERLAFAQSAPKQSGGFF